MTVGSGWSVQRAAKAGDGFVLTAPGRVTKLRASSEQEELEVSVRTSICVFGRDGRYHLLWTPGSSRVGFVWGLGNGVDGGVNFHRDSLYSCNRTVLFSLGFLFFFSLLVGTHERAYPLQRDGFAANVGRCIDARP